MLRGVVPKMKKVKVNIQTLSFHKGLYIAWEWVFDSILVLNWQSHIL